jgi:hypothetical protein
MFPGHLHFQEIVAALSSWDGDRQALTRAAELYWSASFYDTEWPDHLRESSAGIMPLLMGNGSIQTRVATCDDAHAANLAQVLLLFASAVLNGEQGSAA